MKKDSHNHVYNNKFEMNDQNENGQSTAKPSTEYPIQVTIGKRKSQKTTSRLDTPIPKVPSSSTENTANNEVDISRSITKRSVTSINSSKRKKSRSAVSDKFSKEQSDQGDSSIKSSKEQTKLHGFNRQTTDIGSTMSRENSF